MPVAPPLGFLGIAKETVKGTPVAATQFIPIRQGRTWKDELMMLDDDGMRGSMYEGPYDQIPGPLWSTYDCDGPGFADTMPWWVLGCLGEVATSASRNVADAVTNSTTLVTSATAAFTQADVGKPILPSADFAAGTFIQAVISATNITISKVALTAGAAKSLTIGITALQWHSGTLKNTGDGQPTSFTLTDFYGLTGGTPARQMAGCQVEEVTLKFAGDGFLEHATKLQGFGTAQVAKPANALGAVTPHPGWEMQAAIGGAASLIVVSGELTLKRKTAPIHTADGTQAPYRIQQGGINVAGKLSLVAEDDSEYLRYLNHTLPVVNLGWVHGAGAATVATNVEMSKCNVNAGQPKHDGDYMAWDMTFQALPNAVDVGASGGVSPCRIGFQNALAAATFQ